MKINLTLDEIGDIKDRSITTISFTMVKNKCSIGSLNDWIEYPIILEEE